MAVELKNVVVELAAQLRSPNPYVGNPDLGGPRCAAESDDSERMVGQREAKDRFENHLLGPTMKSSLYFQASGSKLHCE